MRVLLYGSVCGCESGGVGMCVGVTVVVWFCELVCLCVYVCVCGCLSGCGVCVEGWGVVYGLCMVY